MQALEERLRLVRAQRNKLLSAFETLKGSGMLHFRAAFHCVHELHVQGCMSTPLVLVSIIHQCKWHFIVVLCSWLVIRVWSCFICSLGSCKVSCTY